MTTKMADKLLEHANNETWHHDDIQQATYHKPTYKEVCGFCSRKCFGTFGVILGLCIVSVIVAVIVGKAGGWLIGAGVPFVLTSVFASEIFGGTSVDRGQVFLAFFLHAFLMNSVMLGIELYKNSHAMPLFLPLDAHNLRCRVEWYEHVERFKLKGTVDPLKEMNITTAQLQSILTPEDKNTPCYGMGLAVGLGGAVPEEILKFATIGAFVSRGWIADPWAVVVYCFVIGSTFGFIENLHYVAEIFKRQSVIQRWSGIFLRVFLCQTIGHASYAIITGLLFAQRKFLFWREHGELKTCCEFGGPRPFYLIMLPAMWFHFASNFLAASVPDNPLLETLWTIGVVLIEVASVLFAYYLFLTLKNVPKVNIIDLQQSGQVPKALSYICCCGCCKDEMGQRDRRYGSVINMVNMKGIDKEQVGEQYIPPIITES
eukprot:g6383.t1